jgi:hypothetical protein
VVSSLDAYNGVRGPPGGELYRFSPGTFQQGQQHLYYTNPPTPLALGALTGEFYTPDRFRYEAISRGVPSSPPPLVSA